MTGNMRAILETPGKMIIEECEIPTPKANEVVVKLARVGMCGSDIHGFRFGPYIPPLPGQIVGLGHEPAGVVTAIGEDVTNLKIGDRVALEPGQPDYTCEFCLNGHYNVCPNMDFLATAPNYKGAFTHYMAHPAQLAFKLPDNMTLEEGALVEPASVAVHAVEMAGSLLGKTVIILGSGAVGMLTLMVAKNAGAKTIVVVDVQESRLAKAIEFGATAALNGNAGDIAPLLKEKVGEYGADVVFETAGAIPTIKLALQVVKRRGKILVVGTVPGDAPIPFLKINREVSIQTVFRYCNNYPQTIEMINSGVLNASAIVDKHFNLSQIQEAFEFAAEQPGAFTKGVIVIDEDVE